ncbi:MAG: UDP-glucose/GDP-mannose dehydrogenase family protein [Chthoniobacter sp.]
MGPAAPANALGGLRSRTFAILGLTYTPHTDTLRPAAVELCQQLLAAGATVRAFDPAVPALPADLAGVHLGELPAVLDGSDAVVVCTEWPQFRQAPWGEWLPRLRQPVVVDANRFLEKELLACRGVEHLSVGRPS